MHCGSKVRYFYREFDLLFLFLRAVVNMTVISQDDHLTAGAWAACGHTPHSSEYVALPDQPLPDTDRNSLYPMLCLELSLENF